MNRIALVTGGGRGIGRGIALELARLGWDLLLNYANNEAAARETAGACVAVAKQVEKVIRAQTCKADISRSKDRERLIESCKSTFKRLDLLVNNAGIAPAVRSDVLEAGEESFDRLIQTNV